MEPEIIYLFEAGYRSVVDAREARCCPDTWSRMRVAQQRGEIEGLFDDWIGNNGTALIHNILLLYDDRERSSIQGIVDDMSIDR